ncbi:MAG: hypothetical protein U0790_03660 [Isosphaeraceae bacterium]
MANRRQTSRQLRRPGPRRQSLLDLFFPDWRQARDRRRKAVAVAFLVAFTAVLLSALARRLGWDSAALIAWLRQL